LQRLFLSQRQPQRAEALRRGRARLKQNRLAQPAQQEPFAGGGLVVAAFLQLAGEVVARLGAAQRRQGGLVHTPLGVALQAELAQGVAVEVQRQRGLALAVGAVADLLLVQLLDALAEGPQVEDAGLEPFALLRGEVALAEGAAWRLGLAEAVVGEVAVTGALGDVSSGEPVGALLLVAGAGRRLVR